MILFLIAITQETQVFFGPRYVILGRPPHPVVVGMRRTAMLHNVGDDVERLRKLIHQQFLSSLFISVCLVTLSRPKNTMSSRSGVYRAGFIPTGQANSAAPSVPLRGMLGFADLSK